MSGAMTSGQRITWVGLWVNLALGLGKGAAGVLAASSALVADALHSLVDLTTDLAALFGLRMAGKPGDDSHPYGHHRFASISTLFIAVVLTALAVGICVASAMRLHDHTPVVPGWPALAVALVSLAVKEVLFWFSRAIAHREKSRLLLANAWHHRTDSLSSLLVVLGLAGILAFGEDWAFLDQVLGLALGAWLAFEGLKLARRAVNDLVDAFPGNEIINDLREHVLPVDGVVAYHKFRARRVGDMLEVDLHVQVAPGKTVAEGHAIAGAVKASLLSTHPEVLDVLVHLEPADVEHLRIEGISDYDARELVQPPPERR